MTARKPVGSNSPAFSRIGYAAAADQAGIDILEIAQGIQMHGARFDSVHFSGTQPLEMCFGGYNFQVAKSFFLAGQVTCSTLISGHEERSCGADIHYQAINHRQQLGLAGRGKGQPTLDQLVGDTEQVLVYDIAGMLHVGGERSEFPAIGHGRRH